MSQEIENVVRRLENTVQLLLDEVRSLRGNSPPLGWMRTPEAAIALKSSGVLSPKHLRKLLAIGAFEMRVHVRDVGFNPRPVYEFHIERCRERLDEYFLSD